MQIYKSFTPQVVELLKNGGVGVIPTDTVYGLVGQLFNQAAVERIYDIKDRPSDKPVGTILIGDVTQIDDYIEAADLLAAEVFWPAPVSVVLPLKTGLMYAHRGWNSLPFRIPDDPELQQLLMETGPLATTSANIASMPAAVNIQEALGYFRAGVDFYVDGGDLSGRKASKIIKVKNGEIEEIRAD
jgi:L-threonylcarbamoyladenylate synthase